MEPMNLIDEMKYRIRKLNEATKAYDEGHPIMTDKEWDDKYFRLQYLEHITGIILAGSPTANINYEVVNELKKVKHNHPMLSLDKTKDEKAVASFLNKHDGIAMAKMDGLTCSLRYSGGALISAETRGNGIIGEDITHNIVCIKNVPLTLPEQSEIIIDGEIICTLNDFQDVQDTYANPRNYAAGSIRLLDAKESENRKLSFVAWDCIKGLEDCYTLDTKLIKLIDFGFDVVPFIPAPISLKIDEDKIKHINILIENWAKENSYPIDGVVYKYNNINEYEAAGRTDHHFKGGLAFKFYDEVYETEVIDIDWTMGRTGQLTPVLMYKDINIDGSICNRANLHNISVMTRLMGGAFPGQKVFIYKANQIIPQVAYAQQSVPKGVPHIHIPKVCPYCGEPTETRIDIDSEVLYCTNPNCNAKLINRLDHFCGKKGLDIKGISKMTMEKLIDWGWVKCLGDIFNLFNYRDEWVKKPGFGVASVDKVLKAIEEGKKCTFETYLCAIGIPLIGKVASKSLMDTFGNYKDFRKAIDEKDEKLYQIDGIGEVMIDTLLNFDYTEADFIFDEFIKETNAATPVSNGSDLTGKIFVITGKLKEYKNRDALKKEIESRGGKVTGSVTSKTSYLINNDINSTSSKNETAKKLGIPIISEEDFKNF